MFCTKCGSKIQEGELFCTNCGAPVKGAPSAEPLEGQEAGQMTGQPSAEPLEGQEAGQMAGQPSAASLEGQEAGQMAGQPFTAPQEGQTAGPAFGAPGEEPPEKKHGGAARLIVLACVLLFCVAALCLCGYDLVKTKEFREDIASYQAVETQVDGLGKYESDYEDLLERADHASSRFLFWQYPALAEEMDDLADEIRRMNEAVAEYREQYEEVVQQIETDGRYVMGDHEEEYQSVKAGLESALSDFDEKEAKKQADAFADLRDAIVEENESNAEAYLSDTQNIRASFDGYNAHPFELYMIGDIADKVEADRSAKDYIQLSEDYRQLKEWSDKFYSASQAGEQIAAFVQADVSESDKVKLYLSSYNYDQYNFLLEDFLVYEQNGGVWNECQALGVSQIKGALTMDLVADISGSMRYDFYTMQNALEGFVNSTHSDTALGLSTIGSIYERYQEFTLDKNSIINSVWNLECYGLTSLYQSLYSSVVYTASAEGARCVVAFTDGHNEPYGAGYDYDAQDVIDVSNYYQVPVYIIGLGSGVYSSELRWIAESTGGAYYDRVSIYDLQSIYTSIYEAQGRLYELTYSTSVPNNVNRDIYVLYADDTAGLSVRLESEINAEALQEAYEAAGFSGDDLPSFYTDSKYLSSDDLSKLGDDLEAVQTVINIYYAKNGYQFGDGENGQKQLDKMISLGVITENGTLDGDTVSAILKDNPVLYQNFSALYNYRYELVFSAAYDIYQSNPAISYEDLRAQVNQHYGEENQTRFNPVVQLAWNALHAE